MDADEIYYHFRFLEKSNEKYFDQITEITMAKNRYHFNVKPPVPEEVQAAMPDENTTAQERWKYS